MSSPALVVVQLGYVANRGLISDVYGDYGVYLSRVKNAVSSTSSIIFLYRRAKVPFELPDTTELIIGERHTKKLIDRLKERMVNNVDICGELLWYYGGDINENLKSYSKKLPKDRRIQLGKVLENTSILEPTRIAKKADLDPLEFTKEVFYTGSEVRDGCVKNVYDILSSEFDVKIIRELCYPITEPSKIT